VRYSAPSSALSQRRGGAEGGLITGSFGQLAPLDADYPLLARADAGGYMLRPVDFCLDEVIAECCRAVDVLAVERSVTTKPTRRRRFRIGAMKT